MQPPEEPIFHVELSSKASQDLDALDAEALEAVHEVLDAVESNPRPPGVRRRQAPGHYSLPAGLPRVLYAVDEEARLITIQRIRPRSSRPARPGN